MECVCLGYGDLGRSWLEQEEEEEEEINDDKCKEDLTQVISKITGLEEKENTCVYGRRV